MTKRWIINQDRDEIFELEDVRDLKVSVVKSNSRIIGFNLYLKGDLLGTFDTFVESLMELSNIMNMKQELYAVSGYSNFNM